MQSERQTGRQIDRQAARERERERDMNGDGDRDGLYRRIVLYSALPPPGLPLFPSVFGGER